MLVQWVVFVLCQLFTHSQSELYTAQVDLETLFDLQKTVVEALNEFIIKEELRLRNARETLLVSTGLGLSVSSFSGKEAELLPNPINIFKLVKGLSTDLSEVLSHALDNSNIQGLSATLDKLKAKTTFPGSNDVKGSAEAIVRLQNTYQISTEMLSNGCVDRNLCTSSLSADDCFEIGKQSYYNKNYELALSWMKEALDKLESDEKRLCQEASSVQTRLHPARLEIHQEGNQDDLAVTTSIQSKLQKTKEDIVEFISWTESIRSTIDLGKRFLSELTGVELEAFLDEVVKMAETPDADSTDAYSVVVKKYQALCRGENREMQSQNPLLKCRYSTKASPYLILNPLKEEKIHEDPPVWTYHEVLSDEEIEVIKRISAPHLKTATVVNSFTGATEPSSTRVSKSAWLVNEDDDVIARVNRRIGYITDLNLDTAEDLQIANYGIGGMYLPHFDFSHNNLTMQFLHEDEGNRIATLMFYLSDVLKGGATAFPQLGLSVWPKKGTAVFWYNLLSDGSGDFRTQHGACPVLLGSKWVANKWIHERGQEFKRPCSSDFEIIRLPKWEELPTV